ncbi:DoxX family protein [Mangrovibacterium diazotrophicum]|uniref:Thiosulfate dehydrogenase [quinone] large subunit n=1 Tax=Mangrovibacterium diazotrophicum TaxID=1261403 RepID=A0A419W7Z3_9BACT|nr:MauE/DoxX family redox-associated membrane protein [Mangrovibacterium diazotrophicum]RKD91601.1 thiosulfate dehydrogenase [quinone] large subunit [Mangrovibacterium diazotrophicum]
MNAKYSYFFVKLPMALSLLGHGLVRIPKLQIFSDWMVNFMANSYLPEVMIRSFSYLVPFVEVVTGVLLLVGFYTRQTIYLALALMALFVFGNTTIENWEAITSELLHAGYLTALLYLIQYDRFSLDWFRGKEA